MTTTIHDRLRDARGRADLGADRAAILERFEAMYDGLRRQAESGSSRSRGARKAADFVRLLDEASERLGDQLLQPAYLINVAGDALVRTDLIAASVVEFVEVALYFHGLKQIERRFAPRAPAYLAIHADLIPQYVGRESLVALVAEGRAKIAEGRVFCLTYHYLNALKRRYWDHRRRSEDALDHLTDAAPASPPAAASGREAEIEAADRVGLMMEIFARRLTAVQQLVYLAKNRRGESAAIAAELGGADSPLTSLLRDLDRELDGHGNLGWTEIAHKLSLNEKTAKREYLRALHTLLQESARAVFGMDIRSRYVLRVLSQLREIVYAKDLRIRSNAGEGLSRLVEKWEVALRFVLNHGRVPA